MALQKNMSVPRAEAPRISIAVPLDVMAKRVSQDSRRSQDQDPASGASSNLRVSQQAQVKFRGMSFGGSVQAVAHAKLLRKKFVSMKTVPSDEAEDSDESTSHDSEEEDDAVLFKARDAWLFLDDHEFSTHSTFAESKSGGKSPGKPASKLALRRAHTLMGGPKCKISIMIHPESTLRMLWEIVCLILVAYDFVFIPLALIEDFSTALDDGIVWFGRIAWTVDIGMSLCTGVYVGGVLSMRPIRIARHYARTWMLPDLVVVLPSWLSVIFTDSADSHKFSALRGLRFLRFLRLLRMLKALLMMQDLIERWNSTTLVLVMNITKSIMGLFFINHIIACMWYAVGRTNDDGWCQTYGIETRSLVYKYFTSVHWALANMTGSADVHPTNVQERIFAVASIMLAIIMFSSFMATLTNTMLELHQLQQERSDQQRILRKYLRAHNISQKISGLVKRYLHERAAGDQKQVLVMKALDTLPESLLMDIHDEARSPIVTHHHLFFELRSGHPRMVRQLCHNAITQLLYQSGDIVFVTGDACTKMLFISNSDGLVKYKLKRAAQRHASTMGPAQSQDLARADSSGSEGAPLRPPSSPSSATGGAVSLHMGQWIAEPGIWTKWEHCGDLSAERDSILLSLEVVPFTEQIEHFKLAHIGAKRYALAFVEFMNVELSNCNDMTELNWGEITQQQQVDKTKQRKATLKKSGTLANMLKRRNSEGGFAAAAADGLSDLGHYFANRLGARMSLGGVLRSRRSSERHSVQLFIHPESTSAGSNTSEHIVRKDSDLSK